MTHRRRLLAVLGLLLALGPTPREARAAAPPPAAEGCPAPRTQLPEMVIVCVDARTAERRVAIHPRGVRFVKPNRNILVQVLHPSDLTPIVSLGGQVGSWEPGSRSTFTLTEREDPQEDEPQGHGLTGDPAAGDEPPPPDEVSTETLFAPRQPGAVDLSVSFEGDAAPPIAQQFFVEETYSGVFRVGIAGILLGAVERPWQARMAPGSSQAEVSGGVGSALDLDFVVGYGAYFDEGGRGASGCTARPFCFNPYFGVGTFGTGSRGQLDWLKSVHLGVEWELTPTFSVGLTGTLRRVDRLPDGLFPGAPIDGDVALRKAYALGLGVLVNVTPEFLKVGADGARAVLR